MTPSNACVNCGSSVANGAMSRKIHPAGPVCCNGCANVAGLEMMMARLGENQVAVWSARHGALGLLPEGNRFHHREAGSDRFGSSTSTSAWSTS